MSTPRHFGSTILIAIGLLLPSAMVLAADDAAIREAIEARLQRENLEQQAEVSVAVRGGEATLSGVVTSLPAKRRAEKLARKEADSVRNELRVHPEKPVKDTDISEGVVRAVLGYSLYGIFDHVEFSVNEGAVHLHGSVVQPWKRTSIERRVARVAGVRAIENDIMVQSLSFFDSNLRASLARRIYGDARFVQYANWPHPPIRILVDRGNVILAGWVRSPVEKAILGNIARRSRSFSVENRIQVDGDPPKEDRKEESEQS